MERRDCEIIILALMKQIAEIYHQYNPDGKYLTLTYIKDDDDGTDYIDFNNRYYDEDKEHQLNYNTIYGAR